MVYILVSHKVRDFERFRKVFLSNLKRVPNNGSKGGLILRSKNDVFVLVSWKSLKSFEKFAKDKRLPKDSQKLGTVIGKPKGYFFEHVEKF